MVNRYVKINLNSLYTLKTCFNSNNLKYLTFLAETCEKMFDYFKNKHIPV